MGTASCSHQTAKCDKAQGLFRNEISPDETRDILIETGQKYYLLQYETLCKRQNALANRLSHPPKDLHPRVKLKLQEDLDVIEGAMEELQCCFAAFSSLQNNAELLTAIRELRFGPGGKSIVHCAATAIQEKIPRIPSSMHRAALAIQLIESRVPSPRDVYDTVKAADGHVKPVDISTYFNLDVSTLQGRITVGNILNAWGGDRASLLSLSTLNTAATHADILNQAAIAVGLPIVFRHDGEKVFDENGHVCFLKTPSVSMVERINNTDYPQFKAEFVYNKKNYEVRWHPPTGGNNVNPCLRISRLHAFNHVLRDIEQDELIDPSGPLHSLLTDLHRRSRWYSAELYYCSATERFWATHYRNPKAPVIDWKPGISQVSQGTNQELALSVRDATHIPCLPERILFCESADLPGNLL